MKQQVTLSEYRDLKNGGNKRLQEWLREHSYTNLYITIGQMIEFLQDEDKARLQIVLESDGTHDYICDSLWEEVKEVLENE